MTQPATLPTHAELVERYPKRFPCGTRIRYLAGCRCVPCRAANSRYEVERSALRKIGMGNPIVDADKARYRLKYLERNGVGLRVAAQVSGVSRSILCRVRAGKKLRIRRRTETAILSVHKKDAALNTRVDPTKAREQIEWLLAHGWSKVGIARCLDIGGKSLQLKLYTRIAKRNAVMIGKLYRDQLKKQPKSDGWRFSKGHGGPKPKV